MHLRHSFSGKLYTKITLSQLLSITCVIGVVRAIQISSQAELGQSNGVTDIWAPFAEYISHYLLSWVPLFCFSSFHLSEVRKIIPPGVWNDRTKVKYLFIRLCSPEIDCHLLYKEQKRFIYLLKAIWGNKIIPCKQCLNTSESQRLGSHTAYRS